MRRRTLSTAAAILCCGAAVMMLTACKQKQVVLDSDAEVSGQTAVDFGEGGCLNYTLPEKGEEIVVLTIENYGDVKIKLFPDQSPKGVENFTTLVKNGYYDELIFHRVIDKFMIQGGDPKGDGTGGTDAWGSMIGFEQTLSPRLNHLTGAVSYAVGEDKMNKSQFFIVTGEKFDTDYMTLLRERLGKTFTPQIENLYKTIGGAPHLDGEHEIFGQVFDGMEYVMEVQKVPTNENNKPKSAVRIEKAVVTEYDGTAPHWLDAEGGEVTVDSAGLYDEG